MRASRSLVLMLLPSLGAVLLAGCEPPAPKTEAAPAIMPASPEQGMSLQAELNKTDPNARVGHVSAVNTTIATAAVAGIPIAEVHKGDSIQFVDAGRKPVANGVVSDASPADSAYSFLIVDYTPTPDGRAPMKGDLAVYLPHH